LPEGGALVGVTVGEALLVGVVLFAGADEPLGVSVAELLGVLDGLHVRVLDAGLLDEAGGDVVFFVVALDDVLRGAVVDLAGEDVAFEVVVGAIDAEVAVVTAAVVEGGAMEAEVVVVTAAVVVLLAAVVDGWVVVVRAGGAVDL
jgi:hypothetical protein